MRRWLALGGLLLALLAGMHLPQGSDPCRADRLRPALTDPAVVRDATVAAPPAPGPVGKVALVDLAPLETPASTRFGIGMPLGAQTANEGALLGAGWWHSWVVHMPDVLAGLPPTNQMVRLSRGDGYPPPDEAAALAAAGPGMVWVIGNEPDVIWQDYTTPACYAWHYHTYYTAIKAADPSAQVAMAPVGLGTPARLAYLDDVLEAYRAQFGEPMPVDVWTVHGYVLREARGEWGVGMPPGTYADSGMRYSVGDHDDVFVFAEQIYRFRQWMAERGYRDRPLWLTEFGVVFDEQLGFDDARRSAFLARSMDFLLYATHADSGYPADDNRLVQRWAWFSWSYGPYAAGDLVYEGSQTLTPLGEAYRAVVAGTAGWTP